MSLTLGAIVLNATDHDFWREALGFTASENPDFLLPPAAAAPTRLHLDKTDQTHLDLWVDHETGTLESEVDRLIALGAARIEDWTYPPDADFVVLRSPDGITFCVIE
jgi:hypothetical protein